MSDDPAMHLAMALWFFLGLGASAPVRATILVEYLEGATDAGAASNERVSDTLDRGRDRGRFRFLTTETALVFVLGVVAGAVRSFSEAPLASPFDDRVRELVGHVLRGLGLDDAEAARLVREAESVVREQGVFAG